MRKRALSAIATLIESDPRVIFVGSDLGAGTLAEVRDRHPQRVLMEGIAEQHLVGFAAGLALEGYVPYIHTIGTFLTRRSIEQVIVDVALHNLPVRLVASGGGMVYAPLGPTHQSIDDFALMRAIPNMMVVAPADPIEMAAVITDLATSPGPAYVRVGKGGEPDVTSSIPWAGIGSVRRIREGHGLAVLTTGAMLHECLHAVAISRERSTNPALIHVPFVAPIDREAIQQLIAQFEVLLVVEEHLPNGGLATAISEIVASGRHNCYVVQTSLPGGYAAAYGSQRDHLEDAGLTGTSIAETIAAYYPD